MKVLFRRPILPAVIIFALLCALPLRPARAMDPDGWRLVWQDEFDGAGLDRESWTAEVHEKGWVNRELQEYADSPETISVRDGMLVLRPVYKKQADGTAQYLSGRINTRGKRQFAYGRFEARLRVPKGKGYLPAFWLLGADDTLYGGWPRCGEIDIMEILGQDTVTSHHGIHFGYDGGAGHLSGGGQYRLGQGSFSEEFHVFTLDWEPGLLVWYVDGREVHRADQWVSGADKAGTYTYPAPFDQEFYIILNLAVGGDWPGDPDQAAVRDMPNQAFYVDYVRVYQKDPAVYAAMEEALDAPETADPEAPKTVRPDGDYVYNGTFDQGKERLGYWEVRAEGGAAARVTNEKLVRRLTVQVPEGGSCTVYQGGLAAPEGLYALSFEARKTDGEPGGLTAVAGERTFSPELSGEMTRFLVKQIPLGGQNGGEASVRFTFDRPGMYEVDNVSLMEDALIRNGEFDLGLTGYMTGVFGTARAAAGTQALPRGNVFYTRIDHTGSADWEVQLKQANVVLEKGKKYRLTFEGRCTTRRRISVVMQREGSADDNWEIYSGWNVVELTDKWQPYELVFVMQSPTDENALLSVSLGTTEGRVIRDRHTVYLDRFRLERIE